MNFSTQSTGDYFLNFFKQFIGTPAILIGLFALMGCILQRKKFHEIISSTIKTSIGFIIIGGGAGILAGAVGKLGSAFELLFGINGVLSNNDSIPGLFLKSIPDIVLSGSLIMISAMLLNILLARITAYKYIYLSGHVLFYMSVMFASVLYTAGLNKPQDIPVIVISGSLIISIWMVISPAILNKRVIKITKSNNMAIAHTGSLSFLLSGWIGNLVGKAITKLKKPIVSTEDIKFPKGLSFLRNTNIAIAITMFFLYLTIYFTAWGVKGYDALVIQGIITNKDDVFVQGLLQAFTFAAGVEVLLIGVRMFIAEIVPSFKGISEKLVPNAKPSLDCPTIFPYAQNAVLIGFIASFLGGMIGVLITILIVKSVGTQDSNIIGWAVILPSIVPHFFVGATSGVFANQTGGIYGAILGPFINGILMSFIPFIFFGLQYMPTLIIENSDQLLIKNNLTWGDSDFLIGLPFGILGRLVGRDVFVWLLPIISVVFWMILPSINFVKRLLNNKNHVALQKITLSENSLKNQDVNSQDILSPSTLSIRNKFVAVCGQGLGSSLIIEMNIKSLVEELKLDQTEFSHTNINAFDPNDQKILAVICGSDLADSINYQNKIVLNNLLDKEELKQKLIEFLNK